MSASLEDLVALVKARGTTDTFPAREELHGLLEPFRALPDHESLRLALSATARKGDRLVARVACESLAHLGGDAAGSILVDIAMDASLATSQRAAAVWAMEHASIQPALSHDEQLECLRLPIIEMLEDVDADRGFAFHALASGYEQFSTTHRLSFLEALAGLARERQHKLGPLCMHLLGVEKDSGRRCRLLDLAADDATKEVADLLASFAAKTNVAAEAKHARRHIHILRAKGIRGEVLPDMEGARAFVTGCDGDACFAINIIIPRLPTFDLVNVLGHYGSGVRDAFVMRNLPRRSIDEMVQKMTDGCSGLSAYLAMSLAAQIVDEALRLANPKILAKPEVAEAVTLAEPALAKARTQPFTEPAPEEPATTTLEEVADLLDSEPFDYWFFESRESSVQEALRQLDGPIRSKGKAAVKTARNRIDRAGKSLCKRLQDDGEPARLQKMLLHQARLFEASGKPEQGRLCRKLSQEVMDPQSIFLSTMAGRSLRMAMEAPADEERDDRAGRFIEAREHLRGRLSETSSAYRKRDLILLDVSAVAHVELNLINRRAPSARRASLTAIEDAALAVGHLVVGTLLDPAHRGQALVPLVGEILDGHDLIPEKDRSSAAEAVSAAVGEFINSICLDECPHECFSSSTDDGRVPYFSQELPWDELPTTKRPPGRRS